MLAILGNMSLITELDSLVFHLNNTITSVLSNDCNITGIISWGNFNSFGILEANLSWLIIINNCNTGLSIFSL